MMILLDSVVEARGDTLVLKSHHIDTFNLNKATLEDIGLSMSHNRKVGVLIRTQGIVELSPGEKNRQVLKLPALFGGNRYKYYVVLFDNVEFAKGKVRQWGGRAGLLKKKLFA